MIKAIALGAVMYMPALRPDLSMVASGWKYRNLRTVVFCTEDAVLERDMPLAMANIEQALISLGDSSAVNIFVRPRNPEILAKILSMEGACKLSGFILPKASLASLPQWLSLLGRHQSFAIMPTLETKEVFDRDEMRRLRDYLAGHALFERILALRIGALDLLSLLGLRRDISLSIYASPLGHVIDGLISVFGPSGLSLCAPGFESLENMALLEEELKLDASRGLFGKTALHPSQVEVIHQAYMVEEEDLEMARAVEDPEKPAVFSLNGRVCEKAVHRAWAESVMERAQLFGVRDKESAPSPLARLFEMAEN
jgi:citrate lyase beta subunit